MTTLVHDLPPFWDDLAVVWDGWQPPLAVAFICPSPAPRCCVACGSLAEPVVNRGRVACSTVVTHAAIREQDATRDQLPQGWQGKVRRNALYRLVAHRCPDCRHDEVWDMSTDEWWALDASDYRAEGSRAQ